MFEEIDRFDPYDYHPYKNRNPRRGGGDVFDHPDFFVITGLHEIAYRFDRGVEYLAGNHHTGGEDNYRYIDPLPIHKDGNEDQ